MRHFLLLALLSPSALAADWTDLIRKDHPRLFLNADTLPAVKARVLGRDAKLFAEMKARVASIPAVLEEDRDYGTAAAEAAFVWLVSGEHRDVAVKLLDHSARLYVRRHQQKRAVDWYTFSRINAIAAYDWLYNSLTGEQRQRIGTLLLHAVRDAQPTEDRRPFIGPDLGGLERENWGDTASGFYSTPSMLWFAGLAMFRDGIDDKLSEEFLRTGHKLQHEVLSFRRSAVGDDGGSASATLGYWMGAYPWAEFNFFHTWRSATGQGLAREWPYVATMPSYVFWNWLPGMREFGAGDATHRTNELPARSLRIHFAQIAHFYGATHPDDVALAQWLAPRLPAGTDREFPWTRFLLDDPPEQRSVGDLTAKMPLARHFENMGQVFFRSGSAPEDTYALFTAGGVLKQHKHFDNNTFVIFKKGFLALDTGTRPQPGQHLSHYYARTVAHNGILIRMPGEQMPSYWGANPGAGEEAQPFPNDGGQQSVIGSKVVAFESHPEYAYVAGDATASYNSAKCRLALRQFVFIRPDVFVIFDRVVSTDPLYPKTWLLHTVGEPTIDGNVFSASHEEGRLWSRALLPAKAHLTKIGGPGRQFWSDGRNWALPQGYAFPDTTPLFGQWRVEVTPAAPAREDVFLHVLNAAGTPLDARVAGTGVIFRAGADEWEITFASQGAAAGHVKMSHGGRTVIDRKLADSVTPQSGLYGN